MSSIPDSNYLNSNLTICPISEEMRNDPLFSTFCTEAELVFEHEVTEQKTYDFVKKFFQGNFHSRSEIYKKCNLYKNWINEINKRNEIKNKEDIEEECRYNFFKKLVYNEKINLLINSLGRIDQLQRINTIFEAYGEAAEKNSEMKEKLAYLQSLPPEKRKAALKKMNLPA